MKKKQTTHITHEFEREHFPCAKEWWCVEGFFTTIENNKKWSFKAHLYQAIGRDKSIWSIYSITLFDLNAHKIYSYDSSNDSLKLQTAKDNFFIKYDKSYIKGSYPRYQMHFLDSINNINLNLKYNAESLPYWIAQKITDGWLPWGLGFFRFGFILKNDINGTININNQKLSIIGKGYFEHIWGDFSFFYLSSFRRSIKKTISTYAKLLVNWIHNQNIKFPKSILLSNDNRPPGYDWAWILLENGWSVFFGNMTFWLTEGLGTGILILSKDGIKYNEFSNFHFKYNKMKYLKKYDFYYPIELEINATKDNEKLYLHIRNTSKSIENLTEATEKKGLYGVVICEIPSNVDGYYYNSNKKIIIKGLSKMEIHRLLRMSGHNSIKLNFELNKKNFGVLSSLDSHYFGKKLDINLHILPRPNFKICFKRKNKNTISYNMKKEKE
jgi:hypothetical protein